MRTMQHSCWAILGLTLSWAPAFAQAPQNTAPAASAQTAPPAATNPVAATVNGQAIPETAVQRSLLRVPPAKQAEVRPQIVNFLVDQVLLDQFLLQQKIAVDPKEVEKYIDEMKAELQKQKKEFAKMLEEMKLTEVELREHIAADIRWGKFAEERAADKILKEIFESQKYLFDGSMIRARHILLAGDGQQAVAQLQAIKQEIDKQVADGLAKLPPNTDNLAREKKRQSLMEEAFAAQAKAKSACPSKEKGGDVDWFQGVGFMVEPFSRAAFVLKPFEMSEPVKTPFGYHLILVTDRKPGREVKFEEVKEMVKEHYVTRLHDSIVGEARQRANVVINGK
ncbi:MAG TPA: peptidylprolyl isomerase [Gemmataceae bacterium]|nr:peptidylprolyl isomerase [Gemmataceae bacterium]